MVRVQPSRRMHPLMPEDRKRHPQKPVGTQFHDFRIHPRVVSCFQTFKGSLRAGQNFSCTLF